MTFVMVGALLCMGPIQAHALLVDFDPSTVNVAVGDSFTVDLLADIAQTEQILGWDIDLVFDSTQVSFAGAVGGSSWNMGTPIFDDDVSIAGFAGFPLPPGTGIWGNDTLLATLSFDCLADGTSLLDIGTDDALEGFQLAATPAFATWSSAAATVNQASIPDPAAVFLLGSACLLGFAGLRRKFRK